MEQEDDDHETDDHCFLQQVTLQRSDRVLNQSGAVVASYDFNPWRQRSFNLGQLFLDSVDDVESIQPVAHNDNAAHGLAFSLPFRHTVTDVRAKRNSAQVLDHYRRSVLRHHRYVFQVR